MTRLLYFSDPEKSVTMRACRASFLINADMDLGGATINADTIQVRTVAHEDDWCKHCMDLGPKCQGWVSSAQHDGLCWLKQPSEHPQGCQTWNKPPVGRTLTAGQRLYFGSWPYARVHLPCPGVPIPKPKKVPFPKWKKRTFLKPNKVPFPKPKGVSFPKSQRPKQKTRMIGTKAQISMENVTKVHPAEE